MRKLVVDVQKDKLKNGEVITTEVTEGTSVMYRLVERNVAAEPVLSSDQVVDPLISIMGPVKCNGKLILQYIKEEVTMEYESCQQYVTPRAFIACSGQMSVEVECLHHYGTYFSTKELELEPGSHIKLKVKEMFTDLLGKD